MQVSETGDGSVRVTSFLALILSDALGFGLSDSQVSALNETYWGAVKSGAGDDVLDRAERILSPEQFRVASKRALLNGVAGLMSESTVLAPSRGAADVVVGRADDNVKGVVEVEIAAAVVARLVEWAKIFAYFVAIPIALILVFISLFGLSKLQDVRTAADRVNKVIASANAQVAASQKRLNRAETILQSEVDRSGRHLQVLQKETEAARENLSVTQSELEELNRTARGQAEASARQLAELRRLQTNNEQKIRVLGNSIDRIERKLGMDTALEETGSNDPGLVLDNQLVGGGKAYGPWALSSEEARKLIQEKNYPDFKNVIVDSTEFVSAWKARATRDPKAFLEVQRSWVLQRYFTPLAEKVKREDGLDLQTRTNTLQEVVLRMAIQRGPSKWFDRVAAKLKAEGKWAPEKRDFDLLLIRELYTDLLNAPSIKNSRYVQGIQRQREDAIARATQELSAAR